jgi:UDP-glucose 4-epimerase
MHALITGGAGFIGSHLTDLMVGRGDSVTILDDLSTGRLENLNAARGYAKERVEFVNGCVTDARLVNRLAHQADLVVHLAAAVGVFRIQNDTLRSLHINLRGTEVVLEAAHQAGTRLVVASTSEVYGKNDCDGLNEESDRIIGSPLLSRWSYAEAKAIDETLTYQYVRHLGLQAIIIRPFNTTGPRQRGRYGMVVPRFIQQAMAGEPVTVYGTGEQSRSFGHVFDVVGAIATLVGTPDAYGQVFNIGNPAQITINGLAEKVIDRTGSSSKIVHVDYETAYGPGFEDMQRRVPDITKIATLTGYQPKYSLDDVIDTIVAERRFLAVAS